MKVEIIPDHPDTAKWYSKVNGKFGVHHADKYNAPRANYVEVSLGDGPI